VTWNPVTGCSKVSPGCKHCDGEAIVWPEPTHGPALHHASVLTSAAALAELANARPRKWRDQPQIALDDDTGDEGTPF